MERQNLTLSIQHPICIDCPWQKGAQSALNDLIRTREPITEAQITCRPISNKDAHVNADAFAHRRNPRLQTYYILTKADLSCDRIQIDSTFVPLPDEID